MKIEKKDFGNWFYYYIDVETFHGLYNSTNNFFGIGYSYHQECKGFWLRKKYL